MSRVQEGGMEDEDEGGREGGGGGESNKVIQIISTEITAVNNQIKPIF